MSNYKINGKIITNYISANKTSKSALAKKCHIGLATLNKILDGNTNIGYKALFKLAIVMSVRMNDMIVYESPSE